MPWPAYDETALAQDMVEIVVQVNGKLRGRISVAVDADSDAISEKALADENVKRLKDLGLSSTVFDPCAGPTTGGDYLTVMRQNVQNLATTLGK